MTQSPLTRNELIQQLNAATRESSTWTVLFHSAIAGQVGLNITDHKCLDILYNRGAMTAGELAAVTGLTTGAITGVIDRLEARGYARRERDPHDRRKVVVRPLDEPANQELGPLFDHFLKMYLPMLEQYSDDDLRLILRYFQDSHDLLQAQIAWLKEQPRK